MLAGRCRLVVSLVVTAAVVVGLAGCNSSDSAANPSAADLPLPDGVVVVRDQPSCAFNGCATGLTEITVRADDGAPVCPKVEAQLIDQGWQPTNNEFANPGDELRAKCKGDVVTLRRPGQQGWRHKQATQDGTQLK